MKAVPILFSGGMIPPLLRAADPHGIEQKTQTGRLSTPRWNIGDLLYVRESFRIGKGYDGAKPTDAPNFASVWFEADRTATTVFAGAGKLRPNLHLPRWGSRITLEVVGVERKALLDITEQEAQNEGLSYLAPAWGVPGLPATWQIDPRRSYWALWDLLHGPGEAAKDPQVWFTRFKAYRTNVDTLLGERGSAPGTGEPSRSPQPESP